MKTTADAPELSQIITDWRGDAAVLRKRGDERTAKVLEQCAEQAAEVSDDFTTFLTVEDAMRRSGWAHAKVVRHARLYLHTPHVRVEKRAYLLRACIVPRRQFVEMLREAAERDVA